MADRPQKQDGANVHIGATQPTINPAGQPTVRENRPRLQPCVYCGLLTKHRDEGVPVCVGHADLPAIEKGRE